MFRILVLNLGRTTSKVTVYHNGNCKFNIAMCRAMTLKLHLLV